MSTVMSADRIYFMLREIKSIAMEASLTGGMKKGSKTLATMYNRCLETLRENDPAISTLFEPLTEDASVDEIGVSAALLSRYMRPNQDHLEEDDY
ncbi:hypothetical protein GCM10008967_11470 [Bacillus carboniphilus]|uniref:Uncharacterized protein n=1 Tax=Bacillus carboniphilus TaxID=86663 RepID=A0ABN0W1F9_9BACI